MARARRTLDRRTLREQTEAAERKGKSKTKPEDKAEVEEEEDEEEDEDAEEEASGDDEADSGDDDDDEDKPKKKAKKKVAVAKKKAPAKRTRTPKVVRMKVVWAVYSNSHALLQEFAYPKKRDAENYLEKITNDKKSGGPFFMQLLKKPMEKEEIEASTPAPTGKK
ncbi:MAG: hypothetical protein ACJ8C4_05905 [Gemmataceae bacterium]